MKFAAKLVSISLLLVSCNSYKQDPKIETIVAPKIEQTQAAWSHNSQNAGIIDYLGPDLGFLLDASAVNRYNSLVNLYGASLIPPVKVGDGLKETNSNFIMDHEHMVVFMQLSARKNKN